MLPKIERFSDIADKWLFLAAFAAGAAGILALKFWGFPQVFVTLFPVGVMLAYLALIWTSRRFLLREDQAGDGLYYLGLLFTLVSLSVSLHQFNVGEHTASYIVSNFGVALATTITGLALRVVFVQMRDSPLETERQARLELARAAFNFRHELDNAVLEIQLFREKALQGAREGVETVSREASLAIASQVKLFTESTSTILAGINAAFSAFGMHSQTLSESGARVAAALELLWERIEKIRAPEDLLERKIEASLRLLSEANARQAQEAAALVERQREMQHAFRGAAVDFETLSAQVRLVAETIPAWRGHLAVVEAQTELYHRLSATLGQLADTVFSLQGSLARLNQDAEAELTLVRGHREAIEAELKKSRAALGEVYSTLVGLVKLLFKKVHEQ